MLTGLGIGGEYAAINSAIDEFMPARLRGRIDLVVNGSYWIGAAAGAAISLPLLGGRWVALDLGWRLGFAIGGVLGLLVLGLRHWVPESPRWLLTHGRAGEAAGILDGIEEGITARGGVLPAPAGAAPPSGGRGSLALREVFDAMLGPYRSRSVLALGLMVAQAFLFNAVFFTYGLVLQRFYHVAAGDVGRFILPLAGASLLGPVLLGPLFDTLGRRPMIAATYGLTALLLAATAILFGLGLLDARTQTAAWMAIFFVASAAASSAYLTASEIFPLETRALAIALFYAMGTAIGGVAAPFVLGALVGAGSAWAVSGGYLLAAALMAGAAALEAAIGVDAAGRSLEDIAPPLSRA